MRLLLAIALIACTAEAAKPGRFSRVTDPRSSRGLPVVRSARSSQTCIACTCSDSTNYALQSIRFDNAAWTAGAAGGPAAPTVTVSDGSPTYADPAGGFTAQRIQFPACPIANSRSDVLQQVSMATGNTVGSVYIKAFDGSSTLSISVSLYDAVSNVATPCQTTGDWVRCAATTNSASAAPYLLIGCNNNTAYAGRSDTGTADLLVWQGQIEPGTSPTCPITTTTAAVARSGGCSAVCR